MVHRDQEPRPATGPLRAPEEPDEERYQPPAVAWEEEFRPVADSICEKNPLDPACQ